MKPESRAIITRLLDDVGAAGAERQHLQETLTQLVEDILAIELPAPKPGGPRNHWTSAEDNLLRQHYPRGGPQAALDAGLDRSATAIRKRAHTLGVSSAANAAKSWTREEDAIVTDVYPARGATATVNALRDHGHNRTPDAVRVRASKLQIARNNLDAPTHAALARVLADVITADAADMPLDSTSLTPHDQGALRRLRQDNLVKYLGDSLWAPTLAGIAHARNAA